MSDAAQMVPGRAEVVAPGVRRLLAPNPSPMTGPGTNTYLLGQTDIAVVDPGPDDPAHLSAILAAINSQTVSHILITHAHRDHSALAPALAQATGAPICAFGHPEAGRSATMQTLAANGLAGGGEGVHTELTPDLVLKDGQHIQGADWSATTLHTPGHFAGHLAFVVEANGEVALTGDTILGWTSTLISPPDGDVGAFMTTCERLRSLGAKQFLPGHGPKIDEPAERLDWLMGHRRNREAQIVAMLTNGPATVAELTTQIYADVTDYLLPMAERNVLAHLIDLHERNRVNAAPKLSATAIFALR